jgi:hypothetical protein
VRGERQRRAGSRHRGIPDVGGSNAAHTGGEEVRSMTGVEVVYAGFVVIVALVVLVFAIQYAIHDQPLPR